MCRIVADCLIESQPVMFSNMKRPHWMFLVILMSGLAGCSRPAAEGPREAAAVPPGAEAYEARGIVREFRPDRQHAFIEHEEIPGFMMAMTMLLEVRDTNQFNGVEVGDQIDFRMVVTAEDHWIDEVQKTGLHFGPEDSPLPSERQNPAREIEVGDMVPELTLTNELGHPVTLDQLRGRVVAFSFMFTRCPVPDFCPKMSRNFADTAEILSQQTGLPGNWKLLSISFDPENDTPARLLEYARVYEYDPAHWSFLTGPIAQVDRWGKPLGLFHQMTAETIEHNLRTVVLDPELRIREIYIGNEWTPRELADTMIRLLKAGK